MDNIKYKLRRGERDAYKLQVAIIDENAHELIEQFANQLSIPQPVLDSVLMMAYGLSTERPYAALAGFEHLLDYYEVDLRTPIKGADQ